MKKEIKNCGLISLNNLIDVDTISMSTLVLAAKDNGVKLYPYNVSSQDLKIIDLPAIFYSNDHFFYVEKEGLIDPFFINGNVLLLEKNKFLIKTSKNESKNILGKSWVAVGVGAATAIAGGVKASKAAKDKKRAAKEAENMKEVPLTNIAEQLKVSTIGAKNRQEGQSALEATQVAALQNAGTRGILGGLGAVTAGSQSVNRDIAADLDKQQKDIDALQAEDSARIRQTREDRQRSKLAALSSQYNAANDAEQQGYGNIIQGVGMAGTSAVGAQKTPSTTPRFTGAGTSVPSKIGWKPKY